jgi:PadR family transcriptional regulator PadR
MFRNRALGAATVTILKALREGHRFGLDMMQATGLPSGTVYPTLTRMEDRDYVTSVWEATAEAKDAGRPRRRYYAITPQGSLALDEALARLGLLAAPSHGEPSPGPA